ncbi:uncharacterized protein FYW47_002868 [Aplochiton taeniatus]
MTCRHAPAAARLVLLVLLAVTPQLAGAAPVEGEGGEGEAVGRTRTHRKEDSPRPFHALPPKMSQGDGPRDYDHTLALASMLLGVLDPQGAPSIQGTGDGEEEGKREGGEGKTGLEEEQGVSPGEGGEQGEQGEEKRGAEGNSVEWLEHKAGLSPVDSSLQRKIRGYFQNIDLGLQDNEILPPLKGYKAYNTQLARAGKKLHWKEEEGRNRPLQGGNFMDDFENEGEEELEEMEEEAESLSRFEEEALARAEKQEVQRQQEEAERAREEEQRLADIASDMLLQYMGKKQQGAPSYLTPRQKSSGGLNAAEDKRSEEVVADDDDDDLDLDQQMIDRLIEISSKLHLPADDVVEIISDLEEKKKKKKKRKELLLPPNANPANPANAPRFRPLVPLPLPAPPVYHYTASTNPKKNPYGHKAGRKWQKDKAKGKNKSHKQDYWSKPQKQLDYWYKPQKQLDYWYKPQKQLDYWSKPQKQLDYWSKPQKQLDYWSKPQKQLDYWSKPQKQLLAFPSYPYYQKPYRAYYPVYFPYPRQRYYGKPSPSRDQTFGPQDFGPQDFGPQDFGPQDFGLRGSQMVPPRRRYRAGAQGRSQGRSQGWSQGWSQQPVVPLSPSSPYISNYILPHPRTYQPLPPPKPRAAPGRGRIPPYLYPPVAPRNDYEEDGLVPQLDSEEELENFIERIYMKRRMY